MRQDRAQRRWTSKIPLALDEIIHRIVEVLSIRGGGDMGKRLNRQDYTLAVMATQPGAVYEPVQVQKMFFLLDRNIGRSLGGTYFNFRPYDYGPYDKAVYSELEALARMGLAQSSVSSDWRQIRTFTLTAAGQAKGQAHSNMLPDDARKYIQKISQFVRSLSFAELVGAIYRAYPAMKKNSVFKTT